MEPGELNVSDNAIDAVQEMEPPRTKTQLRLFSGMCNVYRKFVKEMAPNATLLNKLLNKSALGSIETINENQQWSFYTLTRQLTSSQLFALPRAELPYILVKHPNAEQIRCVLSQIHTPIDLGPIEYFSKPLTDSERKYDTTERECLAIFWVVLLLRQYLEGTRFMLRADQDPLNWFFGEKPTGKVACWQLRLK